MKWQIGLTPKPADNPRGGVWELLRLNDKTVREQIPEEDRA